MSDIDLAPLDSILAEFAPQGRTALLPALHAAQSYYGYLPEPVAARVGQMLGVPLADVYGVIDFYSMFYPHPVGKTVIQVCGDPACALAGSDAVMQAICRHLDTSPGEMTSDGAYTVERAPCLGLCEHAPAALVGEIPLGRLDPTQANRIVQGAGLQPYAIIKGDLHLLAANCNKGRPTSLDEYLQTGGYTGLSKALETTPEAVIATIKTAGLVGRGGAAFPTGVKWEGAAAARTAEICGLQRR